MSPDAAFESKCETATAGRILRVLRELRGLSQRDLARRSGLNKTAISDYETGKRDIPESRRVRLLRELGFPLRAWDETRDFIRWLAWLGEREEQRRERHPARHGRGVRTDVDLIAARVGRTRERETAEVLDLLLSRDREECLH